jgi:alkanesulfonate monooxygenase SsuD/methylene tetrahydromethanopterin reductase-like flavin-dependent oxidoreductase (luciferase family)
MPAIEIYRSRFRPSSRLQQPYVMLGFNVFAADTDDEARVLVTSAQQAFVNLRSGRPSALQPPIPGFESTLTPPQRELLSQVLACSAIGSASSVRQALQDFISRTQPDELIIASMIYDHAARLRSYEITASIAREENRA